jgi:hypothetical protein
MALGVLGFLLVTQGLHVMLAGRSLQMGALLALLFALHALGARRPPVRPGLLPSLALAVRPVRAGLIVLAALMVALLWIRTSEVRYPQQPWRGKLTVFLPVDIRPDEVDLVVELGPGGVGEGAPLAEIRGEGLTVLLDVGPDVPQSEVIRLIDRLEGAGVEGLLFAWPGDDPYPAGVRVHDVRSGSHPALGRIIRLGPR